MPSSKKQPLFTRVLGAKSWPEAALKVGALAALTHVASRSIVTESSRAVLYQPIQVDLGALPPRPHIERLYRKVGRGEPRVEAWLIPARGLTHPGPAPLIVFAHGATAIVDWWAPLLEPYADAGYNVLLVEFRGYGRSGGKPSQKALVSDIKYFYDQVVSRPDVDPRRVYFHGHSLGAAVVTQLSRSRRPAALILHAPFMSVPAMAKKTGVPAIWMGDAWDSLSVLRRSSVPVAIFHGRRDTVVPIFHGRRLAEAAKNSLFIELDCGHNDCKIQWPKTFKFLGEHAP